ncbi:MAG: thioredoxin [Patescibacteria group bacterium]
MADTQHTGAAHITDDQFDAMVLKSDKPVMVDFFADWCGPCKLAAPILDEMSESEKDVIIVKMNVDENQNTPKQFGVMSIPTVIMFKGGEEVDRQVGFSGRAGYEKMIEQAK